MDPIVDNIWLTWNLTCMLKTYRTYNPMVGFSKYKFNNKLLDGVTLLKVLKVTPSGYINLSHVYI